MAEASRRWLILVHQLPAHPSNLRVRIWRRLQQVGAVVLRNSLYVLPATAEAREDFNWVREEIRSARGQVSVLEASAVDGYTETELVRQFRQQRTADYEALAADIRKAGKQMVARGRQLAPVAREGKLRDLRERYATVQGRDYFAAAGRHLVEQAFRDLETTVVPKKPGPTKVLRRAGFRRRTWVTRPRPGIDRMASAWLIRRFIAPDARFAFANSPENVKPRVIPFDMADVEFGHHGTHCTFETFMARFDIRDAAVVSLSRVVHDLDLKEARFGMPECPAVARLIDGLRLSHDDDEVLLEHGMVLMEALYRSFSKDGVSGRGDQRLAKTRRHGA